MRRGRVFDMELARKILIEKMLLRDAAKSYGISCTRAAQAVHRECHRANPELYGKLRREYQAANGRRTGWYGSFPLEQLRKSAAEFFRGTSLKVMICGVDCHLGDENCNGYCTGKAARAKTYEAPDPAPVFELIFSDGRHIKLWENGHVEGVDESVIAINRIGPARDLIVGEMLRRHQKQMASADAGDHEEQK